MSINGTTEAAGQRARKRPIRLAGAACAVVLVAYPAAASRVYEVKVGYSDGVHDSIGSDVKSFTTAPAPAILDQGVSASVSNDHGGTLSSTIVSSPGGARYTSLAYFQYSLDLVAIAPDAAADAIVPIHITAVGTAVANFLDPFRRYDYLDASSHFVVVQNGLRLIDANAYDTGAHEAPTFSVDGIFGLAADQQLYVGMYTEANYTVLDGGPANASATVDPTFTIDDPYWAARFKIVGIPTGAPPLPPTGGVPEPASWVMMLAGFGLTGATIRRRRRTGAVA